MIIWFFFSAIALILAYFSQRENFPTSYKMARVLLVLWLSWFVSFGSKGMTDQAYYAEVYQGFTDYSLLDIFVLFSKHLDSLTGSRDAMEMGYQLFGTVFNLLGFGFVGFAFFYSLVLNTLMVKFIYRYRNPVLVVLIFIATTFYSQQGNLMRQMMAVAVFLYATKFILSHNLIKYTICIFIASLFHASVLVLLPVYLFAGRKIPTLVLLTVWLGSVLLNFVGDSIPLIQQIRSIDVFYYDMNLGKDESVGVDTGFSWLYNTVFAIALIFYRQGVLKGKSNQLLINLFFLGVFILNLRIASDWFFRLSIYFTIVYIALLPALMEGARLKLKHHFTPFILSGITLLPVVYYVYIILSYVFRDLEGYRIGTQMYEFYDLWK